ncbi:MAG TPA: HPr-rel-A system PqqD family peptide chaperone [Bacteroidales bacterium]|nr:HPr-rel-A system PqqD family peptide chaperone [Bacteroidales bacterium]
MKLRKNIAISESGFVFDASTGDSFSLNEPGKEIMELMARGSTNEEITKWITSRYDINQESFERYLEDFTGMLRQYQLLEPDDDFPGSTDS